MKNSFYLCGVRGRKNPSERNIQVTTKEKTMISAVTEALVRAVPLTFERATQGFTTSIMATSPILTEVFNEDHYIITIFNAPFEQFAGI